jgi:hypothetical protein
MRFRDDDRGVTVQVGAVLLLGILVVVMSIYQVSVVPAQNENVEFQHSLDVQSDLEELRGAILASGTGGGSRPATVTLGTRYPSRTIFINPPPATGSIRTVNHSRIVVSNARADGEVGHFWTGGVNRSYSSKAVVYEPNYRVFGNAPNTTYESSLVYNQFENGRQTAVTEQSLIEGRQITLVAVNGTLRSAQSGTVTVDAAAVSASSRTVTVSDGGDPIVLRIPSAASNRTWERVLRAEGELDPDGIAGNDRYVRKVRPAGDDSVRLVLETGVEYDLRLARVGLGTGVSGAGAAYVTDVELPGPTVDNDTAHRAVVEVRDRFNNPVSGREVTAGASAGSFDRATRKTDERGRASFRYTAPGPADVGTTDALAFEIDDNSTDYEHVRHTVEVAGAGGAAPGAGGGDGNPGRNINPNSTNAVVLAGSKIVGSNCGGGTVCREVAIGLENLDQDDPQDVTEIRLNFYSTDATNNNRRVPPKSVVIENTTARQVVRSASEGGRYVTLDPKFEIGAGRTRVLQFNFSSSTDGTSDFDVEQGDFFVFSVIVDGQKYATYFVAPTVDGSIDGGSGRGGGGGGGGSTPRMSLRVDDLTRPTNGPTEFVASYDVSNANASFKRVEVEFGNVDANWANATKSKGASRGGLRYSQGGVLSNSYRIRAEAIYEDANGEYVAAERTILTAADGRNPSSNDDLSTVDSALFDAYSVEDRSKSQTDDVVYRFDYDLTGDSSFSEVELGVIAMESGNSALRTLTDRSVNNEDLQVDSGTTNRYRLVALVYDSSGAVVDVRIAFDDDASGNGIQ